MPPDAQQAWDWEALPAVMPMMGGPPQPPGWGEPKQNRMPAAPAKPRSPAQQGWGQPQLQTTWNQQKNRGQQSWG